MAQVHGYCDPKFEKLRELLGEFVESGQEVGATIAVNIGGEDVVDLWAGYADEGQSRPWEKDTIVNVFSCTKSIMNLAVLMLIDRGLLDANEKVSRYWPEFAANGKEDIRVRHFLSHTSGVPGWNDPMTLEDLCDFDQATAKLAQQSPWWEPGTASGYHAFAMGHLLGELVRRTTGKTLKQFVADEIAGPLQADFQIGALERDWPRISNVIPPIDKPQLPPDSITAKVLGNPTPDAPTANTALWRQAEIGAGNGHGNARSMARILSAITLGGQTDGKRLLSKNTIDLIFNEQAKGIDLVLGSSARMGIGSFLTGEGSMLEGRLPAGKVCFGSGWGGSFVVMDIDRGLTIAYAMNKMVEGDNSAAHEYMKAVYTALGVDVD